MTTAFPSGLDNFTNPTPADRLSTPGVLHTDQHSNANDAIEALERAVGVTGSSDPTSLDYKVAHITSGSGAPFQTDAPANVGANAVTGTSGSVPHADHVHQGVHSVFVDPNAGLTGDIALVSGTNISITQSSGSFTITNTMGAGGITFDSTSPQDVGASATVGTSGSPPHGDHVHRGVHGVFVAPNTVQYGDVELVGQNGMAITQSSGSFVFNQDLSGYVQTSRTISTTAPLSGGGDLSANRTISIPQSGAASDGYLSSTDWNAFNAKPSGLTPFETDTPADVGASAVTGTSGSVPHSDHVHRGVHGLFTAPNASQYGDIALVGSPNISVTQSSGSFTIASSGSFIAAPGGNDTEVQFNQNNVLAGSRGMLWNDNTYVLTLLGNGTHGGGFIQGASDSGANTGLTLFGGNPAAASNVSGGFVLLSGGQGDGSGIGGAIDIDADNGGNTANGGAISIVAGQGGAASGSGGNITITGGAASGGTTGGSIILRGGIGSSRGLVGIADAASGLQAKFDVSGLSDNRIFTFPDAAGTLVLTTRAINTTAPLSGGGNLSVDRTLIITKADHTTDGYLSATDWTTFNSKVSNATPFSTVAPANPAAVAVIGTSGSMAYSDHVHQGVHGLFVAPNTNNYGDIALVGSPNITVTQSSGSFTLGTSGSFVPLAAGADWQVQFNDVNIVNGDAGLLYDKSTRSLIVGGISAVGNSAWPNSSIGLLISQSFSAGGDVVGLGSAIIADAAASSVTSLLTQQTLQAGSYTVSAGYGLFVSDTAVGAGVTLTNSYGILVQSIDSGSSANYAIYTSGGLVRHGDTTDSTSSATGALTVSGGAGITKNLVVGAQAAIGTTPAANVGLTVQNATYAAGLVVVDSNSNTVATPLIIDHEYSGTAAAGFGAQISFVLKTSTTVQTAAANDVVTWQTATHASRKARRAFTIFDTSERTAMYMDANGTNAIVTFPDTTDSTSSTTGAVVISGGAGIASALSVGTVAGIGIAPNASFGMLIDHASQAALYRVLDAGTTNTPRVAELRHRTSGTAAAGFGIDFIWTADSATVANRAQYEQISSWVVATDASRTARVTHNVYDTASREAFRIEASGTAALIGFLGAGAVARQVIGAAAPAGGTGATAGAYDTAAHRDSAITLLNNIRTALINLGLASA